MRDIEFTDWPEGFRAPGHGLVTGLGPARVRCSGQLGMGLVEGVDYWIIVPIDRATNAPSEEWFRLAASAENARDDYAVSMTTHGDPAILTVPDFKLGLMGDPPSQVIARDLTDWEIDALPDGPVSSWSIDTTIEIAPDATETREEIEADERRLLTDMGFAPSTIAFEWLGDRLLRYTARKVA